MFVVVTVLGLWVFPQLKWIMDRHSAIGWAATQAEYWHDLPVSQKTFFGTPAPWQIRMFGETGVERISVVVEPDAAVAKQIELQRLFPEADVFVGSPGPGYKGKHAR